MKKFDRNISPFDAALEQRPKVFQSVSVNVPFRVTLRVINDLMHIFIGQLVVRAQRIGENFASLFNILANGRINVVSSDAFNNLASHARRPFGRVTFKQSEDNGLANNSASNSMLL